MKVVKFGGSSLANATQIRKVGSIIQNDNKRKYVIVSAPGKRDENDQKITDLLIQLGDLYFSNKPYIHMKEAILSRFQEIIMDLQLSSDLTNELEQSLRHILECNLPIAYKRDYLKAFGEDSTAKIMSLYLEEIGLHAKYVNPQDAGIVVSDEPGNARILSESLDKIQLLREREEILVIPGFFGYTKEGNLLTFSRGGSDITGSIIAAGLQAELYENFTDVDFVYVVNPSIVNQPKKIATLTYKEMRELSYAGFSVFHDEALMPAFKAKIPVAIKNTNNPSNPGTHVIAEKPIARKSGIVGVASDKGFSSLYISKYLMNRELGFGRKLLQILEEENISFEHVPSGIDDLSVIMRSHQLTDAKIESITNKINTQLQPDTLKVQHHLAMIMIVGEGMMNTIGIAQKATSALTKANVNIMMINQGSSEVSMMFGIMDHDLDCAVKSLYETFF
ncbi:aspartate kinase [Virgibacillus soli]|uniref:aspartate kinase n=1 Tax=Paracerasibacillus soli TaxID=480284 RepID=UPI0035EE324B